MEKIHDLVYIVQSGDRGAWVWPMWEYYYHKNWPHHENPFPVYFMAETLQPPFSINNVVRMYSGLGPWGRTVRNALIKHVQHTYCILTHEDYLITDKPNIDRVRWIVDTMRTHNLDIVKMCGSWAGWDDPAHRPQPDPVVPELYKYDMASEYITSHQPSIWRTQFLIDTIEDEYTPWCHETQGTARVRHVYPHARVYADMGACAIPYAEVCTNGQFREGAQRWVAEYEQFKKEGCK